MVLLPATEGACAECRVVLPDQPARMSLREENATFSDMQTIHRLVRTPGARALLLALCALLAGPSTVRAQNQPRDLTQVSIEDLMRIEITSVSRKEQPAVDVAARSS